MYCDSDIQPPEPLERIARETVTLGFEMSCDDRAGNLLRFLAGGTTVGRLLEIGTGTGVSTCWLLDGMDAQSELVSVDNDGTVQQVARRHLGNDPRVTFHTADALELIRDMDDQSVDLVFADAWPGKFECLDLAL